MTQDFEGAALNRRIDRNEHIVEQERGNSAVMLEAQLAMRREMNSRFDQVNARLDGVETRLDGVETRLDGVETRLDGVETRLSGVETRLSGVETRLSGVERELRGVGQQMQTNHEGIMNLLTELVGRKA